jgi:hypothetical protein
VLLKELQNFVVRLLEGIRGRYQPQAGMSAGIRLRSRLKIL